MSDPDNVVYFNGITSLDLPAERILNKALKAELTSAVVIGWNPDGEFYFASSIANGPEVVWLLEKAKLALLNIGTKE